MKEIAERLEEIKDVVYELEGLLELARLRREKVQELLPLMQGRLAEINTLFTGINRMGEKPSRPESPVMLEESKVIEEEVLPQENPIEEIAMEEFAEATEYEEKEDSDPSPEPEPEPERTPEVFDIIVNTASPSPKDGPKPAFCINDRFRFRRELFGGSDAGFSSAMDLVATMDNYEEAEEYFIEELGWDPEDPNVADFLAIIERYFSR